MKFFLIAVFLSFLGVTFSLPLAIQLREVDTDVTVDVKEALSTNTKATTSKVSASSVTNAANAFAKDANTVSSSLNALGTATDSTQIKSLASTAFKAETDEDQRRAVLFSAAGSAGNSPNSKIVANTPTVLTGLKNIMNKPTTASTKSNLATIEKARNADILPSITQLSNSALKAVGMPATAQKFAATTGTKEIAAAAAAKKDS